MKRFKWILVAVLPVIFILTACRVKQETRIVLKEVSPLGPSTLSLTPKQEVLPDTELPASLPIYENKYPVSHGGPQYEFDEAAKEELEQAMNSFLELLYREAGLPLPASGFSLSEPEEGKEQDWNHRRAFETDQFSLFGWPGLLRTKISLNVSDPLVLSIKAGDTNVLLEHFAVRAAMRYVGIDDSKIDLQRLGDDTLEYQIMETPESIEEAVYRTAFASVRVELLCMEDRAVLYVDACRLEPEKLAEVDAFSRDEVMAFVQQNHPDFDVDAATCKLYFESDIEPGQYRPCYKVENETGETVYVAPYLPEEAIPLISPTVSPEAKPIEIQEVSLLVGEDGGAAKYASDYFRADKLTNLPETLPIFENRYYDWSLREYTMDELEAQNPTEDLEKFLNHFYEITGRAVPENGFTFSSSEEDEAATAGKDYYYACSDAFITKLYRRIGFMTVLSAKETNPEFYEIVKAGNAEEIMNDPLIQSAVWFAGYEEPELIDLVPEERKNDPPTYETIYMIADKLKSNHGDEEKLYRESFSCIEIVLSGSTVIVRINFKDPVVLSNATVVPFEDALRYAQEKYPEYGITAEKSEIHYFPNIRRGELIPAYQFVPTQGDFYGNIYISATDYDLERTEG